MPLSQIPSPMREMLIDTKLSHTWVTKSPTKSLQKHGDFVSQQWTDVLNMMCHLRILSIALDREAVFILARSHVQTTYHSRGPILYKNYKLAEIQGKATRR